jgi:hypothetical protein
MEEKILKINSLEINCQSLIEFSSLIKVLLELAKKQQETEKKLDEHDTKINDLMKTITNINNNNNQKEHKENNLSFIDDEINFNNFNDFNMGNDFDKTVINETKYLDKENPEADNKEKTNEENKKEKDENTKENKEKKESDNDNNIIIIENQINDNNNKINEDENQIKKEKEEEKEKVIPIGTANNMDFITINKNINNANNIVNDSNKNNNSINNNNINTNTQSEKKVKQEPITIIKHVDKSSSKSNEIISKLIQRIIVLEKKVAELNSKSNDNMILRTINSNKKNLIDHTESIKNLKEQTEKLGKELTNIKERLQDFNIYDMFKEGGDGDVDITKALIKALESKTNKRFDLFEEKYKLLSTENFKNKDDIKNQGILINGQKIIIEKNNEKISKLLEDQKNKEISDKELKEKENEEFNKKFEEIIKSIEALGENYDNKLLELETKLSEQQKQSPVLVTDIKPEKKQDKKKLENENIIKEYNERILELEKNMRQLLKKLNIEELNSNLAILQKEISKKGNQGAIDELIDRLYNVDENIKQINYRVDSSQAFEKKMIEENSLLSRKFETFANQVNRLSLQVIKNPKDDKPIIDYNKFIEIGVFEENKKETSIKFDKIRISFEDILKHIDEILDRLSHTPSDKDFSQYQEIIKSMLDEYRINNNKKYADKYDTSKNFKFLETQIKSITESYNKKLDGQDNWLLAKKPLNNYLCASCEGIIKGELDKRCDYIPWNKYPNREEKYTRMGHGFSHMLQMVNDDIRKNVDNKEKEKERSKLEDKEKDYNSDEDKKKNSGDRNNSAVKLPKVKIKPKNYNNVNLIDDTNWEKSPYDNFDRNLTMNDNTPQIMKISRIRKNISIKNNSTQEASLNDESNNNVKPRISKNIQTFPNDSILLDKNKGDSE